MSDVYVFIIVLFFIHFYARSSITMLIITELLTNATASQLYILLLTIAIEIMNQNYMQLCMYIKQLQ